VENECLRTATGEISIPSHQYALFISISAVVSTASERFRCEFQNWVVRARRSVLTARMMDREEATRFLLMRQRRGLRKIAHLALEIIAIIINALRAMRVTQ